MYVVGIAGGSGSGKTTFANKILQKVNRPELGLLHMDSYYLPSPPKSLIVSGEGNFDHPDAFDWDLFAQHVEELRAQRTIEVPSYDFTISRRTKETTQMGPIQALLVEGIFTLYKTEIRELFDLKTYLHVDADIRFIRRLHRDSKERGRTLDNIIRQYYDTVRPMFHMYLEPTKQYADVVVGEETDIAADLIAAILKDKMGLH